MTRITYVVITVTCVVVGSSVTNAQTDPRIGTWQLNLAKSKVPSSDTADGSDTRTYEATSNGTKMTWVIVNANGSSHTITYTAKLDGKDYPVTGAQNFDSVAFTLLSPKTLEMTTKKAGVVFQRTRVEVSEDGRTMTQHGPEGGFVVFDKVR
jgi:hypothetical protein